MFEIARILCAVDFSDGSRHALDQAVAMARQYGARLIVVYVHALSMPVPVSGEAAALGPVPLSNAERAEIVQGLAELVAADRQAGIPIDTVFEEDVSVPRAVLQCAEQVHADLVVVGTHGQSGFNRLVLGSIANRLMKTAARPVLVVPAHARDAVPLRLVRIVCPVDFSAPSIRALDVGASLGDQSGAAMTVVHVLELGAGEEDLSAPEYAAYRRRRFEQARRRLDVAVQQVRTAGRIDALLLAGKPHQEILRVALEQQADLVVLGAQGKGTLDPRAFGSTTHRVAREATCPVLIVPPR